MTTLLSVSATDLLNKFTDKEFPRIYGTPTFKDIRAMQRMTEANAAQIETPLGGTYGYLFLTKTDADWTTATNLRSVQLPVAPAPALTIPRGSSSEEIAHLQHTWNTETFRYEQMTQLRTLLINQIVNAMDEKWIKFLQNPITKKIQYTIPEIYEKLYKIYTDIDDSDVFDAEAELRSKVYDIQEPLEVLFDELEDFKEFAKAAEVAKTDKQIIKLALKQLSNMGEFDGALKKWYRKAAEDQTWTNLKSDFTEEHLTLRMVRGKSMKNSSYNQANILAETIKKSIQGQLNNIEQRLIQQDNEDKENVPPPLQQEANNVNNNDNKLDQLLAKLNNMEKEIANLKSNSKTTGNNLKFFEDGGQRRRYITKYCWSCGASNHNSEKCQKKQTGHQEDATFDNKKGGSTLFCKFVQKGK